MTAERATRGVADRAPAGLAERLVDAVGAGCSVILTGNTGDLLPHDGATYRIVQLAARVLAREGWSPVVCSSRGIQQVDVPGAGMVPLRGLSAGPGSIAEVAPRLLESLAASERPVGGIIDFVDLALPQAGPGVLGMPEQQRLLEALLGFPIDRAFERHRLIVIARTDGLDTRVQRSPGWELVRVGLPALTERVLMARRIRELAAAPEATVAVPDDELTDEAFAALCGGLTLDDMTRVARHASREQRTIARLDIQALKSDRLRQRHVRALEVHEPGRRHEQVFGLDAAFERLRAQATQGTLPRVLVLAGPPGCGKTTWAKALADYLGWPAATIRNYRGPLVGDSEDRLRDILEAARAMAPLLLILDEADGSDLKQRGGYDADGGTSGRLTSELLGFLGDSLDSAPILLVCLTNRVEQLDPATLSRAEVWPVLNPGPTAQAAILRQAAAAKGWHVSAESAEMAVEQLSDRLVSGRTMMKIVSGAVALAGPDASELGPDLLAASIADLWEESDPLSDELEALEAVRRTTRRRYLPWSGTPDPREVPPYLRPLLDSTGEIDWGRLRARVAELRRQRATGMAAVGDAA